MPLEEVNFEFTKGCRVILSNMVATSHMWVFTFKWLKLNKIRSSVPQSH